MENLLEIGQIVNSYGIKGYLKVVPYTDDMHRYSKLKNIYIDKNKNDVNTKFILGDEPSINLIKTNSDVLSNALNQQGYACHVNVAMADADTGTSTVNNFIDTKINTSATSDMKRFSFDIRA